MNKLTIVEAPFNLGLFESRPGKQPGVASLPKWLEKHGFYAALVPDQVITLTAPAYSIAIDLDSGIRNATEIRQYSIMLSETVYDCIQRKSFTVVIGGDCSVLIGCAHALKSFGEYGLFFIDGHTDFVTTALSATKAAAGMDLALVTGLGHEKLTDIDGLKPYIYESNALSFGNRYQDEKYLHPIKQSKVGYFDLARIRISGIQEIVSEFLTHVRLASLDGIWIHLDVDVLDDQLMPCVDSRQAEGLDYRELKQVLTLLLASGIAVGISITILDPDLDTTGAYTQRFVNEIADIIAKGG